MLRNALAFGFLGPIDLFYGTKAATQLASATGLARSAPDWAESQAALGPSGMMLQMGLILTLAAAWIAVRQPSPRQPVRVSQRSFYSN